VAIFDRPTNINSGTVVREAYFNYSYDIGVTCFSESSLLSKMVDVSCVFSMLHVVISILLAILPVRVDSFTIFIKHCFIE